MKIIVKKLGGENAAELYRSSLNIISDHEKGKKQVIVVSAIRSPQVNTTDYLISLGEKLSYNEIDKDEVMRIIDLLLDFHMYIAQEKLASEGIDVSEQILDIFDTFRSEIEHYISLQNKNIIPSSENDYAIQSRKGEEFSLLGFGERASAHILSHVITEISKRTITAKSIDLSHITQDTLTQGKSDREIFRMLEEIIYVGANNCIVENKIPVIGGYMGVFHGGIENTIGRGYTDATAAICIVGFSHHGYEGVLEIQKSVRGVLSADPRMLYNPESARLITQIDYATAREITGDSGANAKLLHSQAIRAEVQEAGVKIHLFDPFCISRRSGTWVLPNVDVIQNDQIGRVFIGGRKNIVFFSISSGKMFESGILAKIFTTVKDYFSVDIISASETEVSFTIDANKDIQEKLDKMEQELRLICNIYENTHMEFVEYATDMALVFCVGQGMRDQLGFLARASSILSQNGVNIEIVSQGRLQRAMVFGIQGYDLKKAINVLHDEFIENIS